MHMLASIPFAVALPLAPVEPIHWAMANLTTLVILTWTGMASRGSGPSGIGFSREVGVGRTSSLRPADTTQRSELWMELNVRTTPLAVRVSEERLAGQTV
jgi:hypothetical protein